MTPSEARQVRVRVGGYFLARLLEEGHVTPRWRIDAGLPPDAHYVRCYDDPQVVGTIVFVFEHESFPPVQHGNVIPIKDIEVAELPEGGHKVLH